MNKTLIFILMLFCVFGFTICAKAEITDEQFDELCMILIDNLDPDEYSIINNDLLNDITIKHNEVVLIGPNCKKIRKWVINNSSSNSKPFNIELMMSLSNYSVVDINDFEEITSSSIFWGSNAKTTITSPSFNVAKARLKKIVEQYKNKKAIKGNNSK